MISVIIYGRNDSHGYNLPRRAAISLNCIAETLTDPEDEILFVDYNTPKNYPTFIESIDDTLTEKAKKLIKIIRVPPEIHDEYKGKTRLVVSEPLARNIALRRSNPKNRWILSTNSDMIFVPRTTSLSLSDIAKELPDGSYGTARFELPESLWECLDRKNPVESIQNVSKWAEDFNLKFVVYRDAWVVYDAPGDFQLMLRDQLFKIHGFDESMILGWHVDSNISKRLFILNKETRPLIDKVYGYHCLHTRQTTQMHSHKSEFNSLEKYVFKLEDPYVEEQKDKWGLPDEEFEMMSLSDGTQSSRKYLKSLEKNIEKSDKEYYELESGNRYEDLKYSSEHMFSYLGGILATYPKTTKIAYIGGNSEIKRFLINFMKDMGMFPLLIAKDMEAKSEDYWKEIYDEGDLLIFDFGIDRGQYFEDLGIFRRISSLFKASVERNTRDVSVNGGKIKEFIAINARENFFEKFVNNLINCNTVPVSTFCLPGVPFHHTLYCAKKIKVIESEFKAIFNKFSSLNDISKYIREPYHFGDVISFSNPGNNVDSCLDRNWIDGRKGMWTVGNKATLFLSLIGLPGDDVKIKILLKPCTRPWNREQELSLFVNDIHIKKIQFKHRFFQFQEYDFK